MPHLSGACRRSIAASTAAALCTVIFITPAIALLFLGPPEREVLILIALVLSAYGAGVAFACTVPRDQAVDDIRTSERFRFDNRPVVKFDAWAPSTQVRGAIKHEAVDVMCAGDSDSTGDLCVICLEPKRWPAGGGCRGLPCGHTFHARCLDIWCLEGGRHGQRCPLCRHACF
mmetsp:Transcript_55401/g.160872  ORF Transcript_55401/g.160872 Transcript_55401/m.160872 type:complete len:173 (-) Transcript_55401:334-852(-)